MAKILAINEIYNANLKKYTKIDGIMAIFLLILFIGFLVLLAVLSIDLQVIENSMTQLYCTSNLIIILITVLFVVLRKQKIETIGIIKGQWKKSCAIGLVLAIIFFVGNFGIEFFLHKGSLKPFKNIMLLTIYFLIIAFCEELVFRGYIQTRLHGFIKNRIIAVLIGALMFTVIHFPSGIIINRMTFYTFGNFITGNIGWIINLFVMHIIWDFTYKKTNSLYGSILSHWISNLAGSLLL